MTNPDALCRCEDPLSDHEEKGCIGVFCTCKQFIPAVKPEPRREMIGGIPFEQIGVGQDTVRCCLCVGVVVDVGGELQAHLREHQFSRMEED